MVILQTIASITAQGSQFSSHVSVNTPARSFTHGVGDPLPTGRRPYHRQQQRSSYRNFGQPISQNQNGGGGYPRVRPAIPFNDEDIHTRRGNSVQVSSWQQNHFMDISIPVLPISPYKVDSPDPESLWPEGLFLPPIRPVRFGTGISRRGDTGEVLSGSQSLDPYLLEGTEAIAAVRRADAHGHLYFHEIPHIQSLLANQELRVKNKLKPHRIASIRHTWPYNRP